MTKYQVETIKKRSRHLVAFMNETGKQGHIYELVVAGKELLAEKDSGRKTSLNRTRAYAKIEAILSYYPFMYVLFPSQHKAIPGVGYGLLCTAEREKGKELELAVTNPAYIESVLMLLRSGELTNVRECETCGKYFLAVRKDQRFCPGKNGLCLKMAFARKPEERIKRAAAARKRYADRIEQGKRWLSIART